MKNKLTCILVCLIMLVPFNIYAVSEYTDVPKTHWAYNVITDAASINIMNGRDDGSFGLGDTVKRSEFASMLTRLMKWKKSTSISPLFSDITNDKWYFADVNTLKEHNISSEDCFRPDDNITRQEMAVMLVKALGYSSLAETEKNDVFTDVATNEGYISVAYYLGIINGKSENIFDPDGVALREEAAAMMMRVYNKLTVPLSEIHGFYAISSWGQKDIATQMDTVSFGWSRLMYTDDGKVYLNQSSNGGNDWCIPKDSHLAIEYVKNSGAKIHLAVTMTDQNDCNSILLTSQNRTEAINQIISATAEFDGVTIDFEGMKGIQLKEGLNSFIKELKEAIGNKKIYVAVHPVLKNSKEYFDSYDYKTLGEVADRIILMAHDYAASSLPDNLLNTDFIATPVTPFEEIFTALKAITNPIFGVSEREKIQLAISTASTTAWNTTDKQITNGTPIHPSIDTVLKRLSQDDTEIIYSQIYKNPYAFYNTEENKQILLWYEDARSVKDKIILSKMFDIKAISIWRIGAIAEGDPSYYMNIWDTISAEYIR